MAERSATIAAFLAQTPYAGWAETRIAGDASARRYTRLQSGEKSVIVMDAGADPSTLVFADIAVWLRANGLQAPEIFARDVAKGLLLLEDLGQTDLAGWIVTSPDDASVLYQTATDVLIKLDGLSPPPGLPVMTPAVAGQMLDVTSEWYGEGVESQALIQAMAGCFTQFCGPATVPALRDYHAENLIWRPRMTGTDRIGLLDFQDAFIAPRGYDLISLTRDVRRSVEPSVVRDTTAHFAKGVGTSAQALGPALATLAVQRNLRILGVFARLARRDGKPKYMRMMPHLWDMISADLQHPALAALKQAVAAALPPPEQSAIKDLL